MNRREFLTASGAVVALGAMPSAFAGADAVEYSAQAFDAAMKAGKPLLLDFYAHW